MAKRKRTKVTWLNTKHRWWTRNICCFFYINHMCIFLVYIFVQHITVVVYLHCVCLSSCSFLFYTSIPLSLLYFSLHCHFNSYASIYRFYQTYKTNVVSVVRRDDLFSLVISKFWNHIFLHKKRNNRFHNSKKDFSMDVYTYWTNMAHHILEETVYLFTTFVSFAMLFMSCNISSK